MRKPCILYAIQGTGNGHVSRAREIIPILQKYCELDLLLSGDQSEVNLGAEVKFRLRGLTFIYDKTGGISYFKTFLKNNPIKLIRDILKLPVKNYDIVINDFEFTSAWACYFRSVYCYGLGHQASFLSNKVPRPAKRDWIGETILGWYAPSNKALGFHFSRFDHFIEPPVIRSEIRQLEPQDHGYITVYLPAYGDDVLESELRKYPDFKWHIFSKFTENKVVRGNLEINPIDNSTFIKSLENCSGLLTSAGFEGPAEALYLGKKLCVIPIRKQYEQYCNAAGLQAIGIPSLKSIKDSEKLNSWLNTEQKIQIDFPDQTDELIRSKVLGMN